MNISVLVIRILFLALPGILGNRIYQTLKGKPSQKDWEDLIDIALFSLISYSIIGLSIDIYNWIYQTNRSMLIFQAVLSQDAPFSWSEIYIASLIGILLALAAAYMYRYNVITLIGKKSGATKRISDQDVWSIFEDQYGAKHWVYVRDHKTKVTYYGYIKLYSDSEKKREILLGEVDIYPATEKHYTAYAVYISRDASDMSIEVPYQADLKEDKSVTVPDMPKEPAPSNKYNVTIDLRYDKGLIKGDITAEKQEISHAEQQRDGIRAPVSTGGGPDVAEGGAERP